MLAHVKGHIGESYACGACSIQLSLAMSRSKNTAAAAVHDWSGKPRPNKMKHALRGDVEMLQIKAQRPEFLAEISGIDFTQPPAQLPLADIVEAMDKYAVVVFRATGMTDEAHIAFSRLFGELELSPRLFGSRMT